MGVNIHGTSGSKQLEQVDVENYTKFRLMMFFAKKRVSSQESEGPL